MDSNNNLGTMQNINSDNNIDSNLSVKPEHFDAELEPILVLDKVNVSFGSSQAVKDLSFTVNKGEIFGLLGQNGAGKTTTIRAITGQIQNYSGSISVFGIDPKKNPKDLTPLIGVMQEDAGHYLRLSCYSNLCFFARLYGLENPQERVLEMLEKVSLIDKKNAPVKELSRGMKQRLAFARAMIGQPKLLFLDEPTSGLDPVAAISVRKLINDFCELGGSVFLTTHYMEEAQELCRKIAIIHKGSLLCCGNPLELIQKHLPSAVTVKVAGGTIKRPAGLEELFSLFSSRID